MFVRCLLVLEYCIHTSCMCSTTHIHHHVYSSYFPATFQHHYILCMYVMLSFHVRSNTGTGLSSKQCSLATNFSIPRSSLTMEPSSPSCTPSIPATSTATVVVRSFFLFVWWDVVGHCQVHHISASTGVPVHRTCVLPASYKSAKLRHVRLLIYFFIYLFIVYMAMCDVM